MHIDQGFFVDQGSFELVLLLGGACVALALAGAARYRVDARIDLLQRVVRRTRSQI